MRSHRACTTAPRPRRGEEEDQSFLSKSQPQDTWARAHTKHRTRMTALQVTGHGGASALGTRWAPFPGQCWGRKRLAL